MEPSKYLFLFHNKHLTTNIDHIAKRNPRKRFISPDWQNQFGQQDQYLSVSLQMGFDKGFLERVQIKPAQHKTTMCKVLQFRWGKMFWNWLYCEQESQRPRLQIMEMRCHRRNLTLYNKCIQIYVSSLIFWRIKVTTTPG